MVLGALNVGAFFALVYVAAQFLPTSIVSTVMATSPILMMLFAWLLVAERLRVLAIVGGGVGLAGVALLLAGGAASVDSWGVAASVAATSMPSLGYVLAKRCGGDIDVLSLSSLQLIAGGAMLLPVAAAVEGAMPLLDGPELVGFAYVSVVATALAFAAWFTALRRLEAGVVGLVGLLNPVTGVLLGVFVAGGGARASAAGRARTRRRGDRARSAARGACHHLLAAAGALDETVCGTRCVNVYPTNIRCEPGRAVPMHVE